jgi:hypothetical protein
MDTRIGYQVEPLAFSLSLGASTDHQAIQGVLLDSLLLPSTKYEYTSCTAYSHTDASQTGSRTRGNAERMGLCV